MDKQKLEEMQEKVAKELDTQLSKALENADEIWVPTAEFDSLTKALNEQRKQENEADRIEMERQKAEAETELEMAKLDFEREKLAMEAKLAKEKEEAEYKKAMLEAAATDKKSKRDLIGRILDFCKGLLVAILGLAVGIIQVRTIIREEEADTFVNSKSLSFWHKGDTKG